MKRPFIIIGIVLLAAALVRGVELVLEKTLDRQLPVLLTEVLEQEVSLAPIRADIIGLTARTEFFRMGSTANPTLLAKDVLVSLEWKDLLRGEIRLVTGKVADLLLDLDRWPESDEPLSGDYLELDPWLPRELELRSGRIHLDSESSIAIADARWRRFSDGTAGLALRLPRPAGILDVDLMLSSLDDVLALRKLESRITLVTADNRLPASRLEFAATPVDEGGYRLDLSGGLAGMALTAMAESGEVWRWPQRSDTRFESLDAGALGELVTLLFTDDEEDDLEKDLVTPLPELSLPLHRARLRAGELHMGTEMLHDVDIRLSMQRNYLALTRINAEGLYGSLRGSAAAASVEDGWEVALGADMFAREIDHGLMGRYVESHWYASDGSIRLTSRGASPEGLLNDLRGNIEITGAHRGVAETPVSLKTTLDGSPAKFALEQLEIRAGSSSVIGSLEFVGGDTREISVELDSDGLDIAFLMEPGEEDERPGVQIPTYLAVLPGYRVRADVDIANLVLPAVKFNEVTLEMDRGLPAGNVKVAVLGEDGGALSADLTYRQRGSDQPVDARLQIDLKRAHLSDLFSIERGPIDSRTSGSLDFAGSGNDVSEIFASMRGKADLKEHLRRNGEWERESTAEEVITVGGIASLVIEGTSIVGVQIDELDIDSLRQDISGTLSLVSTRYPVIEADLVSERLDLGIILDLLPPSSDDADGQGVLKTLKELAAARLGIRVDTLNWLQYPVEDLRLSVLTGDNAFSMEQLEFSYQGATVTSQMALTWQGETASLDATGKVEKLQVSHLVTSPPEQLAGTLHAPLQGGFNVSGSGETIADLLSGLEGQIKLDSGSREPDQVVDVDFQRLPDGGRIDVNQLRVAGSDLRGKVRRTEGKPDRFDVSLDGGILDIRPWETDREKTPAPESKPEADRKALEKTTDAARGLMDFASKLVNPGGTEPSGDRVFSDQPLNVDALSTFDIHVAGKLDQVLSSFAEIDDLSVDAGLGDGRLAVTADAGTYNGGPVHIDFAFDGASSPYALEVSGTARRIHRYPHMPNFPTSLQVILSSRGISEAELAAGLNGQVLILFGEGPIDYAGLALVNRDVAASMFRTLIPGAEVKPPTMQCGVTLLEFKDGIGITPFGYAARTGTANLLGGVELNLVKEKVRVKFQSRSREGVGISLGNAFSNSAELAGPLSDPEVVPKTTGLLFRGWAALATGGLSIIGESFFNRALASKNPCKSVEEEMRKTICQAGHPLADSPLACPTTTQTPPPQHEARAGD